MIHFFSICLMKDVLFIYLFIYNNRVLGTRITYIYLHIHTDTNTCIQTDKQINDIKFKNIKISILYLHFF